MRIAATVAAGLVAVCIGIGTAGTALNRKWMAASAPGRGRAGSAPPRGAVARQPLMFDGG